MLFLQRMIFYAVYLIHSYIKCFFNDVDYVLWSLSRAPRTEKESSGTSVSFAQRHVISILGTRGYGILVAFPQQTTTTPVYTDHRFNIILFAVMYWNYPQAAHYRRLNWAQRRCARFHSALVEASNLLGDQPVNSDNVANQEPVTAPKGCGWSYHGPSFSPITRKWGDCFAQLLLKMLLQTYFKSSDMKWEAKKRRYLFGNDTNHFCFYINRKNVNYWLLLCVKKYISLRNENDEFQAYSALRIICLRGIKHNVIIFV